MYTLDFAPQALEDLAKLKRSEPVVFTKTEQLPHQKSAKRHIKISPNVTFVDKMIVL